MELTEETQADNRPADETEATGPASRLGMALYGVALLVFALFILFILRLALPELIGVVPDDAFYYLDIARHIAQTGSSSADGAHLTNGYHPAWMLCMVLCARLFANRETLLHACVALALSLHVVGSLLFIGILRRFVSPLWAWIGGAAWLLNPMAVLIALQGLETPLSLCALLTVIGVYLKRIAPHLRPDAPFRPPAADLARFGLSLGFAFLARTEAILLIGVTLLLFGAAIRLLTPTRPALPAILRALAITVGVAALCALPWLLYSWRTVGSLQQDSGAMKMLWTHTDQADLSWIARFGLLREFLLWNWIETPIVFALGNRRLLVPVEIELILFALVVLFFGLKSRPSATLLRLNLWLLLTMLVTGCFYGLFLKDHQIWYCGEPNLILCLLLFLWFARAIMKARWAQTARIQSAVGAVFFCVCLALFVRLRLHTPQLYPWQTDVYLSQPKFESLVPPDARIGCFNSGIPAYFSPHVIVNLDGLVNHSVTPYWRDKHFERYLADAHIDYVADEINSTLKAEAYSSVPLPLHPIARNDLTGWTPPIRWFWRVQQP